MTLNDLNLGRSRDPEGLCAELFGPKVMGEALNDSLLIMLNKIKEAGEVPFFMNSQGRIKVPANE